MTIAEQEEQLFRRWRRRRPRFVPDGIVDEQAYKSRIPRILFIMKEVNGTRPGFDLREFLRKPVRPQTWDNVTRWITGINSLKRDIPWRELAEISEAHRAKMLRSVAVMNVKKTPGGHTSREIELLTYAREDADLLREQFNLYKPDLVICCGAIVAKIAGVILSIGEPSEWPTTTRGVSYRPIQNRGHILQYAHPEARVDDSLIYYGLIDAIRELHR